MLSAGLLSAEPLITTKPHTTLDCTWNWAHRCGQSIFDIPTRSTIETTIDRNADGLRSNITGNAGIRLDRSPWMPLKPAYPGRWPNNVRSNELQATALRAKQSRRPVSKVCGANGIRGVTFLRPSLCWPQLAFRSWRKAHLRSWFSGTMQHCKVCAIPN
jgi:hypothetical protein